MLLVFVAAIVGVVGVVGVVAFVPMASATAATAAPTAAKPPTDTAHASSTTTGGYQLVAADGGIFSFGDAEFFGSTGGLALKQPIVGMAPTPSGDGYWLVASDGGVFSFGDAAFHGSTGALTLARPIVGIAATPRGDGYWLVASDGGVFSFGGAAFHGSAGALPLEQPIVGMTVSTGGDGYWLVGSDGGIFSFGDAPYLGSAGALPLTKPIVGMAAPSGGAGYWLVASDGGIFSYGDAPYFGSAGALALVRPIVGMAPTSSNQGYWLVGTDGGIFGFGDARFHGSTGGLALTRPVVAMHATPGEIIPDDDAPATKMAFRVQPGDSTGGTAFGADPTVEIQDPNGGRVTDATNDVALHLTASFGATLACESNDVTAVHGLATYTGCSIDRPGTYTLTATSVGLDDAVSASTMITVGAPAQLHISAQPGGGVSSTAFAGQPAVTVEDAGGNTVTTDTSGVTLALTNPSGAALLCTANPKAAVLGVATFAGCNVNLAGGYTLTATDGTLTAAESMLFTITPGPATHLTFTSQPDGGSSNTAFGDQPEVSVLDAAANTVTSDASLISLALTAPGSATLLCAENAEPADAGVAAFTSCSVDVGGTYTLTATATSLTSAVSDSFLITPGEAARLEFTHNPDDSVSGGPFGAQPEVAVLDAAGNPVTSDTSSVTLAITGPTGASMSCDENPRSTSGGIATFALCNIDAAGTYTLTATDGSLTPAESTTFAITAGNAARLAFTAQPSGATGGTDFSVQPEVTVQDAAGNTVTTDASLVALSLATPGGATFNCTPVHAIAGVASFNGCSIDKAGTYTLIATDGSLDDAISAPLVVAVGPAVSMLFQRQPVGANGGVAFAMQPEVLLVDAGGNPAGDATSVSLDFAPQNGGTLTCTANPKVVVNGVATFAGCNIDAANTYTLTASDGNLPAVVSDSFTVTTGPAARLDFSVQPLGSAAGANFSRNPHVMIKDAAGNRITTDVRSVLLTLTTPGGASVACAANPLAAVAGVVSFTGCHVNLAGTYTLTASDGSLTNAVSNPFNIA